MKPFLTLALTLVLTASALVGCGCTNQKMDNPSAPTVLPTNEEIWNSTEATTRYTTEPTLVTDPTATTGSTVETSDPTENTTIENHVNQSSKLTDQLLEQSKAKRATEGATEAPAGRMVPRTR